MSEDQPQQQQPQQQPPASGPAVPPQQSGAPGVPQPAYGYPPPGYPQQVPPPGYPQQSVPPGFGPPQGPGYSQSAGTPQSYGQGGLPPAGQQPYPGRYSAPTFSGDAESPDWSAMATQHEDERRRRKRTIVLLSTLGALLVVGGIVTAAVMVGNDDKPTKPVAGPSTGPSGSSSGSPVAKPKTAEEALSRAATDKAPLSVDALFPSAALTVDGQQLKRVATEHSTECSSATNNGLGSVLVTENCQDMYLATYLSDKAAVTVGIAVFDTKPQADRVKSKVVGNVKALRTNATPRFCPDLKQCATSSDSYGRYVVFTTGGNVDLSPVTDSTPAVKSAAAGILKQATDDLKARGQAVVSNAG
ncbi:hypothetical protein [Streptomyces sp. TLI_171]|uniref:hypothetical protein n=1 Tax=Streptomyces sp. TLI_171 TaxID=1938859 RepID=UPI000C67E6E9|nr:hypothetical protein [Streptomyces sp. TLI_171]RKE19532.1 hypothetical protein BX266_2855 [Streptomyces sp. TLI_171]